MNKLNKIWLKYGVAIAFSVVIIFMGINYVFIRLGSQELTPLWSASLRYLISALLMLVIVNLKRISLPKGAALRGSILYGILTYGANSGLLYWAMTNASSSVASVIYATIPLSTILLSSLLGTEKLSKKGLLTSLAVIAGISVIFESQLNSNNSLLSVLVILIASLLTALAGVIVKKYPKSNPLSSNLVAMATGGIILLIMSVAIGENLSLPKLTSTWLSVGWLVASSVLASGLLLWLITKTSSVKASYVSVLAPVVTILTGLLTNTEHVSNSMLIGSGVVMTASLSAIKNHKSLDKEKK